MRNYHSPIHFSPISLPLIPLMYFSPASSPFRGICYWSGLCMCVPDFMHTYVNVFVWAVDGQLWASFFFFFFNIPALLLLALVWGPISQLCWRSINPDRSIVPPLFIGPDRRLAPRYHFQLEKHSWAGMEVDLKWLQKPNRRCGMAANLRCSLCSAPSLGETELRKLLWNSLLAYFCFSLFL